MNYLQFRCFALNHSTIIFYGLSSLSILSMITYVCTTGVPKPVTNLSPVITGKHALSGGRESYIRLLKNDNTILSSSYPSRLNAVNTRVLLYDYCNALRLVKPTVYTLTTTTTRKIYMYKNGFASSRISH